MKNLNEFFRQRRYFPKHDVEYIITKNAEI